jgi:hypothetical protein
MGHLVRESKKSSGPALNQYHKNPILHSEAATIKRKLFRDDESNEEISFP